ncbi:hypothetical protein Tcan_10241 [Toxocara canis]|uniref:Uncharacterized protein n=1 Tax=Toxocara canis TaxID=6265 RepID=A0A0B2UMY1_TOXCA|nr:hypothetical protein Tcan_10241 [Toxocara canis]
MPVCSAVSIHVQEKILQQHLVGMAYSIDSDPERMGLIGFWMSYGICEMVKMKKRVSGNKNSMLNSPNRSAEALDTELRKLHKLDHQLRTVSNVNLRMEN